MLEVYDTLGISSSLGIDEELTKRGMGIQVKAQRGAGSSDALTFTLGLQNSFYPKKFHRPRQFDLATKPGTGDYVLS
jgi:hypothetical protein